jgi:hypothetical protein
MIKRRRIRLVKHAVLIKRRRNACTIMVGEREEKKQLGRPGVDGDNSIKMENGM